MSTTPSQCEPCSTSDDPALKALEEGLPLGWEVRRSRRTGRYYYRNDVLEKKTWTRPIPTERELEQLRAARARREYYEECERVRYINYEGAMRTLHGDRPFFCHQPRGHSMDFPCFHVHEDRGKRGDLPPRRYLTIMACDHDYPHPRLWHGLLAPDANLGRRRPYTRSYHWQTLYHSLETGYDDAFGSGMPDSLLRTTATLNARARAAACPLKWSPSAHRFFPPEARRRALVVLLLGWRLAAAEENKQALYDCFCMQILPLVMGQLE